MALQLLEFAAKDFQKLGFHEKLKFARHATVFHISNCIRNVESSWDVEIPSMDCLHGSNLLKLVEVVENS